MPNAQAMLNVTAGAVVPGGAVHWTVAEAGGGGPSGVIIWLGHPVVYATSVSSLVKLPSWFEALSEKNGRSM